MTHIAVEIGTPDEREAEDISMALVEERLVAGTRLTSGPSHYHWEGAVYDEEYCSITAFTLEEHFEALCEVVRDLHSDDLPGITYTDIDGTDEFLQWITDETR
ncbi:divalent-cation tolerance protein CutA [Halomarina salina]|uniref:Divalent-cation tolerance protein CutA n=1 Tax=Halomarina salina TaxID=1872699 RepID=A0ABD5RNF2_9EURY|nr:divalent cation tolerance protein CutA [Halomarina salina]